MRSEAEPTPQNSQIGDSETQVTALRLRRAHEPSRHSSMHPRSGRIQRGSNLTRRQPTVHIATF
jgi:hypothetical protein